jgi:hypothetical protein
MTVQSAGYRWTVPDRGTVVLKRIAARTRATSGHDLIEGRRVGALPPEKHRGAKARGFVFGAGEDVESSHEKLKRGINAA